MFDRYYGNDRDINVNISSTKKEYRAPTDDSMRLLEELKTKVVGFLQVNDNIVDFAGIHYGLGMNLFEQSIYIKFKINGKDITSEVRLPTPSQFVNQSEVWEKIFSEIGKAIGKESLRDAERKRQLIQGDNIFNFFHDYLAKCNYK